MPEVKGGPGSPEGGTAGGRNPDPEKSRERAGADTRAEPKERPRSAGARQGDDPDAEVPEPSSALD